MNKFVADFFKKELNGTSNASVLDLGGGSGEIAVFLAKRGFNVTLLDNSKSQLAKAIKKANKNKIKITPILSDMSKFSFKKKYDVILAINSLNFLTEAVASKMLAQIKKNTIKGGYNIIIGLNEDNHNLSKIFYFKKHYLMHKYSDWSLIHYSKLKKLDLMHGLPHIHYLDRVIARKI